MALVKSIVSNHRYSGAASVSGDVGIQGTVVTFVRRQVWLYEMRTGQLAAQMWSASNGVYAFTNIAAGQYLVLSTDYTLVHNAVARASIDAV